MARSNSSRVAVPALVRLATLALLLFVSLPSFAEKSPGYFIQVGQQDGMFIYLPANPPEVSTGMMGYFNPGNSDDVNRESRFAEGKLIPYIPASVSESEIDVKGQTFKRVHIPSPHHVVTVDGVIWVLRENGQAWVIESRKSSEPLEIVSDRPGYILLFDKTLSASTQTLYLITSNSVRAIKRSDFNLPSRNATGWFMLPTDSPWELKNFSLDNQGNLRYQAGAGDPWQGQVIPSSSMSEVKLASVWDQRHGLLRLKDALAKGLIDEKSSRNGPSETPAEAAVLRPPEPATDTSGRSGKKRDDQTQQATAPSARPNPFRAASDKIAQLDAKIREDVYGQDHLTRKFALHLSNLRQGLPTVLVVTGPSGVGKSYLAKMTGAAGFQDQKKFVREFEGTDFLLSTDGNPAAFHYLFGAEEGIRGQQKGQLTEWMRETGGNGVLIINEAEKMHPDFWKRLMPLFEKGWVTSPAGETLYANKLLIVLTSNRGATKMFPPTTDNWSSDEIEKQLARLDQATIKRYFMEKQGPEDRFSLPREVINRITEWLVAGPLTAEAVVRVAGKAVRDHNKDMQERTGVVFELDPEAIRHLALTGFKASDDGRQVQNEVNANLRNIEDLLGQKWTELHADKIQVTLSQDAKGRPFFKVSDGVQTLKVPAPTTVKPHPLHDPKEVARLQKIPEIISQRIIGQDAAVKSIAEAVMAVRTDTSRKRPVSIFMVGTTGTGKTEFGRGLALALYDSADRVNVLSLGDVKSEASWAQKFGYVGMTTTPEFEQILINNPQGGVIVFDEASNLGGMEKALKEEFFKRLYEVTEEGVWTSPVTGKKYDKDYLNQFVFLFNGNDGENLFRGMSADDLRLQVWKQNMSKERVRQLLIEAGVPEAFLNRMADTILMRPLTRTEIRGVVVKLLGDRIKSFEAQHRGLKITYEQNFLEQLSDSLFTNDRGARGIRSILDDRLSALLARALIKSKLDLTDLRGVEIRMSLSDNKAIKPYVSRATPERKVEFTFEVVAKKNTVARESLDVTEYASKTVLSGKTSAKWTAIHEAGHAVVNDPAATGQTVRFISIVGGVANKIEYRGYADYAPVRGQDPQYTRSLIVKRIAGLFAGQLAVIMEGGELEAGWAEDLDRIRDLASRAVLEWGLEADLIAIRRHSSGELKLTPAQEELVQQKISALIKEGQDYAQARLEANRPLLRSVAAELLRKGSINGARFQELNSHFSEFLKAGGQCRLIFGR